MLTLPDFQLLRPKSLAEAAKLLSEHSPDAQLIAGGTDILVNMKHRIVTPPVLVDLSSVTDLEGVSIDEDGLTTIGAMTRLSALAENDVVRARYPALCEAISSVAGPQLRNMGTIGGNVCLDTRCVYINQTHFWRTSLGYCLKKDGTVCHVISGGKRCVAAQSSDSVPVLIALDARARLFSARGVRTIPVEALFKRDGVNHLNVEPDEILTHIELDRPAGRLLTAYRKLRVRQAIDFPALSIAVAVELDLDETVKRIAVIGSALMATPRRVSGLDKIAAGERLTLDVLEAVAERAFKQCVPLSNIHIDSEWRREMVPVFVRRALNDLHESNFGQQ